MPLHATSHASAVLFLLLLTGCAIGHTAPRAESLLSNQPSPPGRQCTVADIPEELPGVDEVVDSAALARQVAELWRERRLGPGFALFSLGFDRNGWNSRRAVIEHDLPLEVADSLQQLVFAHRREVPPGSPWGVRLRMDVQETPRFRIGRQEFCAPRLLYAPELQMPAGIWNATDRFAQHGMQGTMWVRVLVDEHGGIADARLDHGLPGLRSEAVLLNYIRSLGFEPATVDGTPVLSWVRLPVPHPW